MTEALFIVCVVLICVVALALAVWLIVTLVKGNRKDDAGRVVVVDDTAYVLVRVGDKAAVAQAAAEPAPVAQEPEEETAPVEPSVQEPEEESCDEEEPEEEQEPQDVEGMITLRRNETLPYPEAYEALSSIEKSCVDDILAYAESKEGAKKVVNDKSASVYYGKKLLVRILLRRDKITARLTVQNNEFIAYTDKEGLNIKAKPVDVRVDTPETIEHIKNIINITYNDFYEERARREEEKREARREARRLKREAEKKAAEEAAAAQPSADRQAEAE